MKTIQMTLDEDLVEEVDRVVKELGTSRSAFTRAALRESLAHRRTRRLEELQRKGYRRHPVTPGEFDVWEQEQEWGDDGE